MQSIVLTAEQGWIVLAKIRRRRMIVAKVSVYDDETGEVYVRDKIIPPSDIDQDYDDLSTAYAFGFHLRVLNKNLDDILKGDKDEQKSNN